MTTDGERKMSVHGDRGGLTIGQLRDYLAMLAEAGCPDEARPDVRVTIGGRARKLETKWRVTP